MAIDPIVIKGGIGIAILFGFFLISKVMKLIWKLVILLAIAAAILYCFPEAREKVFAFIS